MAERIKGLQIDLSMKDMGVQRSIAEIKRSFKGLNADLKLSNNNFKYSEKSLNSYKLRTRELSQAVKESKANVAALKAKYQEAARESGVNSKKAAQLRQEYSRQADNLNYLQKELDQTRDKYREMIAVSKSSVGRLGQTFSEIGPKIKSVGDSMKSVGRNMSMYVTAPIAAGFGVAMKKSIDFDDTMRKVKATSGATGDEFNQLRTKALQMGRDTKFTASESAEAMNYMALAGWDTKDMLKGVGGVMDLAAASGEDLASVSDIVTDNLTAFGMKAKDSTHFADVLAQTSSKANTDVRGLGEAFKYAAPVAGALGYTVEDTSIAIGLMSNAGIKGEKAGTALRTMFTNLAKPTKAMKDEMDKLGISITDSNGEMLPMRDVMDQLRTKMGGLSKDQQAAAASTIFGKEAMSGALAAIKIWTLLKNGVIAIIRAYVAQVRSNFNLVKRIVLTVFNAIKSFSIKVWNAIKNGVINRAKGLWNGVKAAFNALKKGTTAIFNAVKNFALKVWTNIKNSVVNRAKALWSGVKNAWNNLKNGTTKTFKAVGSFMSSKWSSIKSGTVNKAKALWSGVNGAWGSLSKGTHKTMNAIGGFMSKKWKGIKSGTINLVTAMKNKVTGVMDKMGSAIKNVTGKIGGFFGGMIKGVKKGLNTLIKGVNWVGDKLGMEKLPKVKLHTGTESTHTQNFVTNGKINRDTFATVGDKGRGNGPNGFRHEAIEYPNGKMALTPNKDTTTFLPKGAKVYNGAETHSMLNGLPRFSFGTNPLGKHNPKTKKKKKGDNVFGDAWDATKAGAAKVLDGGKAVVSNVGEKAGEIVGKGKKWLKDKIGDVMDWAEKPKKLLDKVLEGFGLNLGGFGIAKKAKLPYDMMKGMYGKLKKAAVDKIKQAFEEQGGDGDGGYIDLSRGINFGFAATAADAARQGYPFARPHHGLDINYPYGTKVYSTVSGKATGSKGYNGGFGNMMSIISGAIEVIYGHLSKLNWTGSKSVKPGTLLGLSGGDPARQGAGAGSSTGPHLHYEMRWNGVAKDPTNWLKKHNGGGSQNKSASKWKGDIKRAAKKMKVNLSNRELNGIVAQIARESNGNAGVTQGNIGDINNLRGTPAQGLLQYVPSTFKSYAVKGHKNIKNGYDQLLAFFNNSNWRRDLPYGKSGWGPSGSRRFATGGLINSSGWYNLAEGGYPEFVIPTDPSKASDAMKLLAIASERVSQRAKNNKRPNQMRVPSQNNNQDANMIEMMAQQLEGQQRQIELLTKLVASSQRLEQKPTGVSEQDVSRAQGKRAEMMAYNMGGAF